MRAPERKGGPIGEPTASLQFRWLAQPLPHGLFVGEILVFLLFRGRLTKHANHGMRQDAGELRAAPGLSALWVTSGDRRIAW